MNVQEREAYVRAALIMQGYRFAEARIEEIVRQFERIEGIAATLDDVELPLECDSAAIFRS